MTSLPASLFVGRSLSGARCASRGEGVSGFSRNAARERMLSPQLASAQSSYARSSMRERSPTFALECRVVSRPHSLDRKTETGTWTENTTSTVRSNGDYPEPIGSNFLFDERLQTVINAKKRKLAEFVLWSLFVAIVGGVAVNIIDYWLRPNFEFARVVPASDERSAELTPEQVHRGPSLFNDLGLDVEAVVDETPFVNERIADSTQDYDLNIAAAESPVASTPLNSYSHFLQLYNGLDGYSAQRRSLIRRYNGSQIDWVVRIQFVHANTSLTDYVAVWFGPIQPVCTERYCRDIESEAVARFRLNDSIVDQLRNGDLIRLTGRIVHDDSRFSRGLHTEMHIDSSRAVINVSDVRE